MFKEIFCDNNHMYAAVLDNGSFIIAYEDGTATDLQSKQQLGVDRLYSI